MNKLKQLYGEEMNSYTLKANQKVLTLSIDIMVTTKDGKAIKLDDWPTEDQIFEVLAVARNDGKFDNEYCHANWVAVNNLEASRSQENE